MEKDYYCEVKADNYRELGRKLGRRFREPIRRQVCELLSNCDIGERRYEKLYNRLRDQTRDALPQIIEELEGYAKGAGVEPYEMWWIAIGDDIDTICGAHCTTVVTNKGLLIGHNEDWSKDSAEDLYIVRKTIGKLTILELYYAGGLGGNAISINSHGYVHSVNSLPYSCDKEGIPQDFIARWLSETQGPESDFEKMRKMTRMSGYSHNFASRHMRCYNIESCAENAAYCENPELPFCHTNHFLKETVDCPFDHPETDSLCRYKRAKRLAVEKMSVKDMKELLSDPFGRGDRAIFNESTIGRVIVDLSKPKAYFWLLRDEPHADWVTCDLDFMD